MLIMLLCPFMREVRYRVTRELTSSVVKMGVPHPAVALFPFYEYR